MSDRVRAVLFDFDYTLVDSSPAVVDCVSYALRGVDLPEASADAIRATIGLSLDDTVVALAGERAFPLAVRFGALFAERADEIMVPLTSWLDGVPQALTALRALGLRTAIISNKFRHRVASTLARDGLTDLFDLVIGAEDVTRLKPDPEGLYLAVARLGVHPDRALYVGDSMVDGEAARRAGIPFAASVTGATPAEALAPYGPRLMVSRLAELVAWLGDGSEPSAP